MGGERGEVRLVLLEPRAVVLNRHHFQDAHRRQKCDLEQVANILPACRLQDAYEPVIRWAVDGAHNLRPSAESAEAPAGCMKAAANPRRVPSSWDLQTDLGQEVMRAYARWNGVWDCHDSSLD